MRNDTFYKDESACHAIGINAELQGLIDGKWVSVAETKGWDKVPDCALTHPVQPWTIASLKEGLELRWRFWQVNQFEVFGPQFRAKLTTEARVAAEQKAKADSKLALKTVTITCTKGKVTKKVTAVKPKCAAGYKKK